MVYERMTWKNVPNPDEFSPEELDSLPRFDADNMNRIEEGIESSLKLKDGYVDEVLKIKNDNMPKIQIIAPNNFSEIVKNADDNGDFGLVLNDYSDKSDTNSKIALSLCHKLANESIDGALRLINRHSDSSKVYKIYGEHNKPTSDDIGALSKTTIINGVDILGVSKDGWYYTENCTNTPIPNANGYMRVMKYGDAGNYKMVEWTPNTSHTKYVNIRTNKSGWLGWVETLHTNNISTLGVAQVQTGTYTGTGVDASGYSYPVNLSFNFTPKYVFVKAVNNKGAGGIHYHGHFLYNEKYVAIFNGSSTDNAIATWGNTTLEWQNTKQNYAAWGLNEANQTYSWIAIG